MPTYSYRCTECGTAFDTQQAFTDDSLTVCPTCGGKLRKLFSAVGVSFSGSGFYRNDSRAAENKKAANKDSGSKDAAPAAAKEPAASSAPASAPSTPAPTKAAAPAKKE